MLIPSGQTGIFPILFKYAYLSQNKLCSQIWRPLYKNKQKVYYFYKFLVEIIIELGFTVTQSDKTVFYNFSKIKNGNYIVIAATLNNFKSHIKLICLGNISQLLEMIVEYNIKKCTISLHQKAFVNIIIGCFHLQDVCSINIPFLLQINLTLD